MKLKALALGAVCVSALSICSLSNAVLGLSAPYLRIQGGLNFVQKGQSTLGGQSNDINYKHGFDGAASIGFDKDRLSYEAQYVYARNDIKSPGDNEYTRLSGGLANIIYHYKGASEHLIPYIGLGIGMANLRINQFDSKNVFAYQGMLGVNCNFNTHFSTGLAYRFLGTSNYYKVRSKLNPSLAYSNFHHYYSHSLDLSMAYHF